MKSIIKILALLFISLNANCQTLPLNGPDDPDTGGYLKDMGNVLPFWVGEWKGEVNNKEYTFQFVSFPHNLWSFPSGNYYYIDELMMKYKVVDLSTNQVLYDDLNITNFEDYKVRFASYNNYNSYSFIFMDNSTHCYNSASFYLVKNLSNLNEIIFTAFEYDEYLYRMCPYTNQEDIPMFLPRVDLTLLRQ